MPDLREIQARAWENKRAKGFNLTDVAYEFGLLMVEVGEAIDAWRKAWPRRRWWHWLFRSLRGLSKAPGRG